MRDEDGGMRALAMGGIAFPRYYHRYLLIAGKLFFS